MLAIVKNLFPVVVCPVEATTHYPTCGWKSSPVFTFYPLDKRGGIAYPQAPAMYLNYALWRSSCSIFSDACFFKAIWGWQ